MNDQLEYKIDKCLEKIHELDIKVTIINNLIERMENAEEKIDKLEARMFKLTMLLVVVLSSLGAHYGVEIFKVLKVLV